MKARLVLIGVAIVGALTVHLWLNLPLGPSLLIFFVGWPLVGTIVTIDDDFKGGWSNPDGTVRPPWLRSPYWGQIVFGVAVSALGFAIDSGWRSPAGAQYILLAIAGGFFAAALVTRRWLLSLGGVLGAVLWGVMRVAV
jgi:hypothetical protein